MLAARISNRIVLPDGDSLVSKYAVDTVRRCDAATISSLMSIAALVAAQSPGGDRSVEPQNADDSYDYNNRYKHRLLCFAENISVLIVMRTVHGVAFFMSVANMAFSTSFIPKDRIGEGLGYSALAAIAVSRAEPGVLRLKITTIKSALWSRLSEYRGRCVYGDDTI